MSPPRDAIVVLGNRLVAPAPHPELAARVDAALRLRARLGDAWLVLSGGRANPEVARSEAEVMAEACRRSGAPEDRLLLEEASLDTLGNAAFSRPLLDRIGARVVHVVTSCYHAERAGHVFRRCLPAGVEVRADACADFPNPQAAAGEAARLRQASDLLEGVAQGDLPAILSRLRERHALYRTSAPDPRAG